MSDSRMNPTPPVLAATVDEFRTRARAWLAEHMPCIDSGDGPIFNRDSEAAWQRARELQRRLSDGGFAGICFPREYSGLGFDYAYQKAFDGEAVDYEMPLILNIPCSAICCATILDMGSGQQKRTHISAALRGDEVLFDIGERVLNFPREHAADRGVPFKQVRRNRPR